MSDFSPDMDLTALLGAGGGGGSRRKSPFDSQLRVAEALSGGGGRRRGKKKRSAKSYVDEAARYTAGKRSTVPELDRRAAAGEFGSVKAQRTMNRLLNSDLDKETKDAIRKVYQDAGGDLGALEGGDKGLLNKVFDNPVVNAIETGMNVIDKPKRAIVATLNEGWEAMGLPEDGNSWADNVLRAEDYGFGDVAQQLADAPGDQGIWENPAFRRGVGLAGDILFDPTTYLTAGTVTGAKAGVKGLKGGARLTSDDLVRRLGQAADAARAADDTAEAARLVDLAGEVAKKGTTAVKRTEDLKLIDADGGLRFLGKRVLPQEVMSRAGAPLGKVREVAGDSGIARYLQGHIGADELADLRIRKRSRDVQPLDRLNALRQIDSKKMAHSQANGLGASLSRDLEQLMEGTRKAGIDGETVSLAVKGDTQSEALLEAAVPGATQAFRDWHKSVREGANALAPGEWIKDAGEKYAARYLSDDAEAFLATLGKGSKKGSIKGKASFEQRAYRAGDKFGDETLGSKALHQRFSAHIADRKSPAAIEAQMGGLIRQWGGPTDGLFTNDAYTNFPKYLSGVTGALRRQIEAGELVKRGVAETAAFDLSKPLKKLGRLEKRAAKAGGAAAKGAEAVADATTEAATQQTVLAALAQMLQNQRDGIVDGLPGIVNPAMVNALGSERAGLLDQIKALGKRLPEEKAVGDITGTLTRKQGQLADEMAAFTDEAAVAARQTALEGADTAFQRGFVQDLMARNTGAPAGVQKKAAAKVASARKTLTKLTDLELNGPAKVVKLRQELAELRPTFDSAAEAARIARTNADETIAAAKARVAELDDQLATLGSLSEKRKLGLETARNLEAKRVGVLQEMATAKENWQRQIHALEAEALGMEAAAAEAGQEAVDFTKYIDRLRSDPKMQADVSRAIKSGFDSMAEYRLADMQLDSFHFAALARVAEVAERPAGFLKWLGGFNKVFKSWAVATPGFHVRNTMGATFMNFVFGVDVASYRELGLNLRRWEKRGIEAVDPKLRDIIRQLDESGHLWDHTNITSELDHFGKKQGWLFQKKRFGLSENIVTTTSADVGITVERFQRAVLAYDMMKKGGTLDEALARVAKVHFDYQDLSSGERKWAKQVVPFWVWTSRNLPLQLEMIYRSPNMYNKFNAVKDNLGNDDDPALVPSWMKDSPTAIHLGDGNYLTPDLPFAGVDEQLDGLARAGPFALMQDMSPMLKAPIELKFGAQSWNNIPIDDTATEMPSAWAAIPGLVPALKALGPQHLDDTSGKNMLNPRTAYTLEQALPLFGRVRRLMPSEEGEAPGKGKYQERRWASVLSFLGVGFRRATDRDKQNQAYRLADELQAVVDRATRRGVTFYDGR